MAKQEKRRKLTPVERGTKGSAVAKQRRLEREKEQLERAQQTQEFQRIVENARARGHIHRRNPYRDEMVKEAQTLKRLGLGTKQIARALNVNPSSITKYLNDPSGERHRAISARMALRRKGITEREAAEIKMNRMDLPISEKITMRPVWKRRQRRIYGQNELPPITDEEKADAIKILGDKRLQKYAPALYFEAFAIFDEASQ